MRGDQLARQWQLIQKLANSRAGVGLDELSQELDVVRRTVYRDLDALMYAGFPVVSEKRDGKSFYRFLDSFGLGDVPFTPDELLALAFGEDLLRILEGTVFHDSIRSAMKKIRAGLGPELAAYLQQLSQSFKVGPGPHKRYAELSGTIQQLHDAVLATKRVRLRYRSGRSGTESERALDPYHVWYRNGGLYVIGHDGQSDEIRTFAIERILEIEPTEERFERPADFDFEAYTGSAFGVIAEPATRVVIRFDKAWKSHVEEHQWHESQVVSELDGGGVELVMEVGGSAELRNWVLSFGSGAEVLEPASLRSQVASELASASQLYS